MADANTGALPTGPMTLEQGVARHMAALNAKGAKANDVLVADATEPEPKEEPQAVEEAEGGAAANDENAEAVSANESDPETAAPDNRPVILSDGSQITVEEARKGYLRQADFTRKTQGLAQERDQAIGQHNAAMQQVSGLYQQLVSLQETEPNWTVIAQDPNVDAKQFQAAQAYWQQKKSVMENARQAIETGRIQTLRANQAKAFAALNTGEFEPKWKDPKALNAGLATVSDYLAERGVPNELLNSIDSHVLVEIAEESRRYRELNKGAPKAALAVKGKPAPMKPGAKSTATPQTEHLRSLEEAFRKNPTVDTATALHKAKAGRR